MLLDEQLAALPPTLLTDLRQHGFDPERLKSWAKAIGIDKDTRNRLPGTVEPPSAGDILDAPKPGTPEHARFAEAGMQALSRGEAALCVLAGGMATRMGGLVKALADALPGKSFLTLRLAENDHWRKASGTTLPLWLMTSEATDAPIREALGERLDSGSIATFQQCVSLRLTPEGTLFQGDDGEPSVYATGHGDLPDALRASGLLGRFLASGGQGSRRTVWIANIDNLGATVDPAILGFHLAHRAPVTVEVVDKVGGDRGGGPVRWNGRPIITEEFRLPRGFDLATVPVFNTNTFLVDAQALEDLQMDWTYVEVEKMIAGRPAVQFERLIGEITTALEPRFLRVPREGVRSRFLPVKDLAELERRRPEIEAIAAARGMLQPPAAGI